MGSTLEHGIYLPSEGEKNCYQGLAGNWNKVDGALGDVAELKQSIESKFTKEIVTELPTEDINPYCIYMILKTDPETDNIYDEWVYINNNWEYLGNTKVDMTQYYTKQEVNQLPAVASGVTATKVGNYDAHIANGDIHVTASDKAKWNTVALIKQLRLVNTQVGSATTIAFVNIDDTNGIKVGDKCMDLDGRMFEITAVDTTNQTVTVGTALIDLALDANVMHLSGNEIKNGELTATKLISNSIQSATGNIQIQSSGTNRSVSMFNGDSAGDGGGFWAYGKDSVNGSDCRLQIYNTAKSRYERVDLVNSQFLPTPSGELDCGGTSNKWKSINGINPGALSLPDFSNAIDISGYITVTSGSTIENLYTPLADGYISVNLSRSSGAIGLVISNGKIEACVRENTLPDKNRECGGFIPVQKNDTVVIVSCLADSIIWAYFIPCLGNV